MKHSVLLKLYASLDRLRAAFKQSLLCVAAIFTFAGVAQAADIGMGSADRETTIRAIQAMKQKQWTLAEAAVGRARDPLAAKIYRWTFYTETKGPFDFGRIAAFVRDNPGWPQQGTLKLAAEKSINDAIPPADIIRWFQNYPPMTADGMDRYIKALLATGRLSDMTVALNAWWGDAVLSPQQQDYFLDNYGKLILKETQKRRFNTTLYQGQAGNARAIALRLGHGYPQLAEARLALAAGAPGVDRLVSMVPDTLQNDPDLMLERLRWRRKQNMDFEALQILHNPPAAALMANPDGWWKERAILTRRLIERQQYESAYLLVSRHGLTTGESFSEAEFLSGWLALRFLKKPWEGFKHFENLYHNSQMPLTRTRAAYWAGVASEALRYPDVARQWFTAGAKYPTAFYGQMALAKLGRETEIVAADPPLPIPLRVAFEKDERIQAARLFHRGADQDNASAFLRAYVADAASQAQFYLAAELAQSWQRPSDSIAVAKKAQTKGIVMAEYAFPTILSRMKGVDGEWALIHGLIRQESMFDARAASPAGAQGLMQLMPSTARELANKNGIGYSDSWLTERPDYNIRLGALYINKMLDRFDQCYPLAIAAYNAGPGRVSQWMRTMGDPCQKGTSMVDWIELIPVSETRNYVQRVLEGVYIYRQKFKTVQRAANPIHVAYDRPLSASH